MVDADEDFVNARMPKSFWQSTWFWVLGWFVLCGAVGSWCFLDVPGFISGETDLFGNYRFAEEQKEARAEMTPMERVHAETFPQWLIAEANQWDSAPGKLTTLHTAVTDDELRAVIDELATAIGSGQILARPQPPTRDAGPDAGDVGLAAQVELTPLHTQLLRRWNDRLEELGEPFYVTGSISTTSSGPALLCEFYRRLAAPSVKVGEQSYATVILQRIDRTNIVEAYLGVARRGDVAVVVTDRILELATDSIWLMMGADTTPSNELAESYAPAVRAEANEGLGTEVVATLAASAIHRKRLLETVASAKERHSCGSTMRFGLIEWDGFNPRDLDHLEAYAERDKIQPCPTIKFEELDALQESSEALQGDEVKHALQALVAWLTRMIALHEARHVADEQLLGRLEHPDACPGCPERMHPSTRAELSAYTASIAWSQSPASALYQACSVRRGPHGRAMRFINRELGRKCKEAPPDDLSAQARGLQAKLFGAATPMELPSDFPKTLEIHRFQ